MNNIYLCFFGDRDRWENVILATAYPSGYSFFRPFTYDDPRVSNDMLNEIREPNSRASLTGNKAILAMRFYKEEFRNLILPIRYVTITSIDPIPQNYSVYFSVNQMRDFQNFERLRDLCIEIPKNELDGLSPEAIFFRSSANTESTRFVDRVHEDEAWAAYCDLIAKDETITISENAKKSMFLRFYEPANAEAANTTKLHLSVRRGPIYGSLLEEGKTYELVVVHRVPTKIGKGIAFGSVGVEYKVPSRNVELSASGEDYSSNYRTHVLGIAAKSPSGTYEQLIITPVQNKISLEDGEEINLLKLNIPYKVVKSIKYRFLSSWVWWLILWAALGAPAIIDGFVNGDNPVSTALIQAFISAVATITLMRVKQSF